MTTSARYEYKDPPGLPLVFRNKKYSCASAALSAYINDFEGREARVNAAKYEDEMLKLFCPQYQPTPRQAGKPSLGVSRTGMSKRETELEKLVQQAYDQLKRLKESKRLEDTMSASSKLLERLDRDRLPSPTRSAILNPSGRPSMGSVATDLLLDARPLDLSQSYVQRPQNNASQSVLDGLYLQNTTRNSSIHATQPGDSLTNGAMGSYPYELKGVNDLMLRLSKELPGLNNSRAWSSENLTVNDLFTSHHSDKVASYHAPISPARSSSKRLDTSLHRDHALSENQLGSIQARIRSEYPLTSGISTNPLASSLDGSLSRGGRGHDSQIEHAVNTSNNRNKSKFEDSGSGKALSAKSSSRNRDNHEINAHNGLQSASESNVKMVSSLPPHLRAVQNGGNVNGSLVDKSSLSGATDHSSSIISGHLLKSKRQGGPSKVVSTPKRGGNQSQSKSANSKQLRFEVDRERNDSAHSKSLDLSNIDKVSVEKPDFSFGRRQIVSILKPPSPDKRRASSRVSFTTDDLIQADASGLNDHPRSRSLPRNAPREFSLYDRSSSERRGRPGYDAKASCGSPSEDRYRSKHSTHSPLRGTSRSRLHDTNTSFDASSKEYEEAKQRRYKQFLETLIREIEDSNSSIATLGGAWAQGKLPAVKTPNQSFQQEQNGQGNGFLARIQELLTSPPSISQYLGNESDRRNRTLTEDQLNGSYSPGQGSQATEAVLDGDRSWERIVPFKSPKKVTADEKKKNTRFERFMDECMAEADGTDKTLTGQAQLGSLETLKNMLFKMQSFSNPESQDNTLDEHTPNLPLDDSVDKLLSPETKRLLSKSYATQPGGPSLAKAMEHLTKLRGLVECQDN